MTAGMLSKNFKATVKQFIEENKGYSFMNPRVHQHIGKSIRINLWLR